MNAEILKSPPISGEYEEHNFSEGNDCLWVKFLDENSIEWVGIFDNNYGTSLKTVIPVSKSSSVLVIVNGQGYTVDINERIIIKKTEWQDVESIIYNEETSLYLASNSLGLMLLDGDKCIWTSERISFDGITFTNQAGHTVDGYLNDLSENGCKYSFNMITRELTTKFVFKDSFEDSTFYGNKLTILIVGILVLIMFTLHTLSN